MADGEITPHRFFLRRAHADDGVSFRYLEGQIVKRVLAESVEVGIPRSPSADIVTSLACVLQDIIARIFDVDGLFRARQWRLGKNGIERPILPATLLDEIKILAVVVGDAGDTKVGQQAELENSFAREKRFEGNRGDAEKMVIPGDDGFDFVAAGSGEGGVFPRNRGVGGPVGY